MGIIARLDLQHYIGINYLVLPEEILEKKLLLKKYGNLYFKPYTLNGDILLIKNK
ncbi:MAG: hypothetical protein ACI93P_000137 [bacterium]|jgi:hypothetical protein